MRDELQNLWDQVLGQVPPAWQELAEATALAEDVVRREGHSRNWWLWSLCHKLGALGGVAARHPVHPVLREARHDEVHGGFTEGCPR